MPALTDKLLKVAAAGSETYMASPGKAIGATSFSINSATGWPTDTAIVVAIRVVDSNGNEVANTYTEWIATLSGTTVSLGTSPSPVIGSDYNYPSGTSTQVYIPLSSYAHNLLIAALLNQHNQDGSHNAVTAASLLATGNLSYGGTFTGVAGSIASNYLTDTCAFLAYLSADVTGSLIVGRMPLNATAYNIGGGFNTSSNLFSATVAGLYHFEGATTVNYTGGGSGSVVASIQTTSGANTRYFEGTSTTNDYSISQQASSHVGLDVTLAAGDTVELYGVVGSAETLKGLATSGSLTSYLTWLSGRLVTGI